LHYWQQTRAKKVCQFSLAKYMHAVFIDEATHGLPPLNAHWKFFAAGVWHNHLT